MKKPSSSQLIGALCASLVIFGFGIANIESARAEDKKLSIAVIPKGTTHSFWKSVEAGARQAAKELDVDMTWKGPLKEDDRAGQIAVVEQFVSQGKSGIVLAPLDDTALRRPVESAMGKKIPVVIIDSALKGEPGKDFVSFVATNNKKGGEMAGDELARLMDNKGKVVLLRYQEGSASTAEREAGFLEAIKKHSDMQVTVDNRYAGATSSEAKTAALNIIDKIRDAQGVFCPNESSTFGMLLALRQSNLAGKIKLVGFDTSAPLMEGLKKKEILALVAQNPKKMGYEGVKALIGHIKGEKVPERVDSGAALITPENVDTPEIQKVLNP